MTWQQAVMWAVVASTFTAALVFGWKARHFNITALALVTAWAGAEIYGRIVETNLPLRFYVVADITVIAIIYAKAIRHWGAKTYRNAWHQLKCMVTDLTPWDRWIVGSYLLAVWPLYVLTFEDWLKWHALWFIAIAQLVLAGTESFNIWRKAPRPPAEPSGSGFLRFDGGWEWVLTPLS